MDRIFRITAARLQSETVLVYHHDQNLEILRGIAAFGATVEKFRKIAYSTKAEALVSDHDSSLATFVFRTRNFVFLDRADNSLIDQEDRSALGIPENHSIYAAPIAYGSTTPLGVIVVTGASDCEVFNKNKLFLENVIRALVSALAHYNHAVTIYRNELAARAHESCMDQVRTMCENPGQEVTLSAIAKIHSQILLAFLKDAAAFFMADQAAWYAPDKAIEFNPRLGEFRSQMLRHQNTGFRLLAALNYPEHVVNNPTWCYLGRDTGLTSEVICSGEPLTSADVENDPRWSRKQPFDNGLRAWMGLPIIVRTPDKWVYYGVITFTRTRQHPRDSNVFGLIEQKSALDFASLLGLGLHNLHESDRLFEEIRKRMKAFLHNIRTPFDFLGLYAVQKLKNLTSISNDPKAMDVVDLIQDRLIILQASYAALRGLANYGDAKKSAPAPTSDYKATGEYSITDETLRVIRVLDPEHEDTEIRFHSLDGNQNADQGRFVVIHVLYSLIENALKACDERPISEMHYIDITVGIIQNKIFLTVEDDGCGMAEEELKKATVAGYSGFAKASAGLGLHMVHQQISNWPGGCLLIDNRRDNIPDLRIEIQLPLQTTN